MRERSFSPILKQVDLWHAPSHLVRIRLQTSEGMVESFELGNAPG